MKFKNWVVSVGGPATLAKKLGMKERSVYLWIAGCGVSPHAETILKLVALSGGQLTCDDIVYETQGKKRKGKK